MKHDRIGGLLVSSAFIGITLVACGGSPSESAEAGGSELRNCTIDNPCGGGGGSGGGTRPHVVRTWSYSTVATQTCPDKPASPMMAVNEVFPFPEDTVWSNTTDPVDSIALVLMQSYGCSTPIRWSTYRPGSTYPGTPGICAPPNGGDFDYAYMHMQLCPYSASLDDFIIAQGYPTRTGECHGANQMSHLSWTACDSYLPGPPAGYVWAITSMDPTCSPTGGGCMIDMSGGPTSW